MDNDNHVLDEVTPVHRMQPAVQNGDEPGPAELDLDWDTGTTLERYITRRPWDVDALFPSREAERMSTSSVRRAVKNAAQRSDVRPYVADDDRVRGESSEVSPHTLRHSVAYRMINEEGARMVDVQMRLRHADLQTTTRVYGHLRRR
jgi:integrase